MSSSDHSKIQPWKVLSTEELSEDNYPDLAARSIQGNENGNDSPPSMGASVSKPADRKTNFVYAGTSEEATFGHVKAGASAN